VSCTYQAVLFDLDGTLIETGPEIADATNDTLRQFGLPEVSEAQVFAWIGHGTHELLIQALAWAGQTSVAVVRSSDSLKLISAEFIKHYQRRCGTRSRLYPQVRATLTALKAQGVKVAVVTNKESRYTQVVLDAHGLTPLLDRVISGDSLPTKKPDPAGIQACLNEWGIAAEHALFVGDSSIDVATARNAGMTVWALPYGYNMGEPIEACQPDRVIPDIGVLV
jgi:phosphoglycolate phosphatase